MRVHIVIAFAARHFAEPEVEVAVAAGAPAAGALGASARPRETLSVIVTPDATLRELEACARELPPSNEVRCRSGSEQIVARIDGDEVEWLGGSPLLAARFATFRAAANASPDAPLSTLPLVPPAE